MTTPTISAPPVPVLFDCETADRLTADQLTRLAQGSLGSLRIRNFFSAEQCTEIMRSLQTCPMGSYDEQLVQPRIAKLGPAAYDFYGQGRLREEYWDHAAQSARTRSTLLHGADPLTAALDTIRDAWGEAVLPASSGGKEMFAGMIREINHGARMHFDEVVREFTGILDQQPIAQLAFNCHLSTPAGGGEAVAYRRRWSPHDEDHRQGYGYDPALVAHEPRVSVRAALGDAVLFDPRNYHLVRPVHGGGRRVTLSFFIAVTARGPIFAWS
ncbi:2OG-Fe(II)-dependent halogenase WelO5 family protein [Streptacidiphilus cavernicola]|uniref:Phytanoyl-CoA dioxygenase family protein n=1 Tax=Streptacidiphilus cavernicola TaxID=3342716 RepID=A0ABV6W615_9ACTN